MSGSSRRLLRLALPLVLLACERAAPSGPELSTVVRVVPSPVEVLQLTPLEAAWSRAPEHLVPLLPQDVAVPKLASPGVPSVRLRAAHDGRAIAFRLEWEDATQDVLVSSTRFSDAAAVQLPMTLGAQVPDSAMGLPGQPVHVLYWKAAWQQGGDPLAALRPNATVDHYPFQAAQGTAREALALALAPARAAGNPGLARPEERPVQDLVAEGFGSLTPAPKQRSSARGEWRQGRWYLTLVTPLSDLWPDATAARSATFVALAIWNGSRGEVGARKMRSAWVPVSLEAQP